MGPAVLNTGSPKKSEEPVYLASRVRWGCRIVSRLQCRFFHADRSGLNRANQSYTPKRSLSGNLVCLLTASIFTWVHVTSPNYDNIPAGFWANAE